MHEAVLDRNPRLADVAQAHLDVPLETAPQQIAHRAGRVLREPAEIDLALEDVRQRVRDGLAVEQPLARENLEQDHAKRPDVGALVYRPACRLLRRHVGRRAHDHAGLRRAHGERG